MLKRILLFVVVLILSRGIATAQSGPPGLSLDLHRESPLLQQAVHEISASEWLAPMAPIALSPFFGVTCLSGMAIWGADWLPGHHALLKGHTELKNPLVFWTFLLLTVLTSLPRMTKVSKPFAQVVDQVEACSSLVALLVFRFMASTAHDADHVAVVYQMGLFSLSYDLIIAFAMIFNVMIINTVKFFFECLVWITPIPFLDACFEVMNKSACLGLMALYAISPAAAMMLNLCLLAVCLLVYRWVSRRVVFFRTMLLEMLLPTIFPGMQKLTRAELTVFPAARLGPFAPRTRLRLQLCDEGWLLTQSHWYGKVTSYKITRKATRSVMHSGWMTNQLIFTDAEGALHRLTFSRRYNANLAAVATCLRIAIESKQPEAKCTRAAAFT